MSEPRWTPAQQAAIADRGGALLVSAAAGSGKTAVLTERAVQLITDPEHPVNADRLLIVTFTNAAAAELRARIGQALLHRSQQQPGNACCAVSGCCCSVRPSAPLTLSVWTCCTSTFRRWISRRILPRQTPAAWSCCGGRHWPKRWKRLPRPGFLRLCRPVRQGPHRQASRRRHFAGLRFPAGAAGLRPQAGRIWRHTSRKTALPPPAGTTCCWRKLPAAPRRPGNCCGSPGRLPCGF